MPRSFRRFDLVGIATALLFTGWSPVFASTNVSAVWSSSHDGIHPIASQYAPVMSAKMRNPTPRVRPVGSQTGLPILKRAQARVLGHYSLMGSMRRKLVGRYFCFLYCHNDKLVPTIFISICNQHIFNARNVRNMQVKCGRRNTPSA